MAIKYAMTYQSTRGEDEGAGYSDIVLKGLAPHLSAGHQDRS